MFAALFWIIATLPPVPAAHVAAWVVGAPDIAPALVRICRRESRCKAIGVHPIDAHHDGWHGQVALGHLNPWCQPHDAGAWTTHGSWGLSAASNWPYLPPCFQPWLLDWPLASGVAAALRYLDLCVLARRSRWCPRRAS